MKAAGGCIVNLSALAARSGASGPGAQYAAARGGVLGLTKALALELGPYGITVNAVAPGDIQSPRRRDLQSERLLVDATRLAATPLGRKGRPTEVAAAVALLCSDAGRYVTGATLDVNGGLWLAP